MENRFNNYQKFSIQDAWYIWLCNGCLCVSHGTCIVCMTHNFTTKMRSQIAIDLAIPSMLCFALCYNVACSFFAIKFARILNDIFSEHGLWVFMKLFRSCKCERECECEQEFMTYKTSGNDNSNCNGRTNNTAAND